MEIDRGRRNGVVSNRYLSERFVGGAAFVADDDADSWSPPRHSHSASPSGTNGIEHRVSRLDTLAGIAIKYGVEVADIKRMNGLVTDLQMFAHKKLYIPVPGRHPPSPVMSSDSPTNGNHTPPRRHQAELMDSFQSLRLNSPQKNVSPAMSLLQGYYGLSPEKSSENFGTEMSFYGNGKADGPVRTPSPNSELPPNGRRKSRSYANGFLVDSQELFEEFRDSSDTDRSYNDKSVRRRQKSDADSPSTPELLMKEENGGVFSGISGKGLVPRPKAGNRTDSDSARKIATLTANSLTLNGSISVRKSSSTSNLQESEPSLWPATKWVLKADSITRPIFDGFPKPMTSRRNKAALD